MRVNQLFLLELYFVKLTCWLLLKRMVFFYGIERREVDDR